MKFGSWTADDWVRHYAGPRWSGRVDAGSAWDAQGRRVPGEMVRVSGGERVILTVDDVREAKARLDARYGKLADEMATCDLLDESERDAFDGLVSSWRAFYCGGVPDGRRDPHVEVVGLAAQMNTNERFEHHLLNWHERLQEHRAAGDTEEQRAEKRRRPALILGAIAGALYFFGPPLRKELFSPVMIQKDLVERRRQTARDLGYGDVSISGGKGIGADLAARVNDALNLTPQVHRGLIRPEPKELPPAPPAPIEAQRPAAESEPEPSPEPVLEPEPEAEPEQEDESESEETESDDDSEE